MNKTIIYVAAAALLVGSLLGGFLVNAIKVCPEPPDYTRTIDSLTMGGYLERMRADSAEARAQEYEERIRQIYDTKTPTPKRVQHATRYYTTAGLHAIDSILGSDPE